MADRKITDADAQAIADAAVRRTRTGDGSRQINDFLRGAVNTSRAEREGPTRARIFDHGKGADTSADDAQAKATALAEAEADRRAAVADRKKYEA
jgi:hypothetical protein